MLTVYSMLTVLCNRVSKQNSGSASPIPANFEAVSAAPRAQPLVVDGKRAAWPRLMSAALPLQYEDAGGSTISSRLPSFRPGPSSSLSLSSGFPDG